MIDHDIVLRESYMIQRERLTRLLLDTSFHSSAVNVYSDHVIKKNYPNRA